MIGSRAFFAESIRNVPDRALPPSIINLAIIPIYSFDGILIFLVCLDCEKQKIARDFIVLCYHCDTLGCWGDGFCCA
jgi:hypothetical protein